jgi:hypothetical protein
MSSPAPPAAASPRGRRVGSVAERRRACRYRDVAQELITSRDGLADHIRSPVPAARRHTRSAGMGSVIKKRRKRMAKKKHRKLLKKTRVQRRNKK